MNPLLERCSNNTRRGMVSRQTIPLFASKTLRTLISTEEPLMDQCNQWVPPYYQCSDFDL